MSKLTERQYFCTILTLLLNMNIKDLRIVFLGTPDFAVASLAAMIDAGLNVVAVVTSPDKPAGRGRKLQGSAVKEYALQKELPVLQPEKLRSPEFLEELASYQADIQVVVAFRMLPETVWNMPPMGTINVHASLLPQYRGAAPIHWAIINGEQETGVTTFQLQHEIDTGNLLLQEKLNISETDNLGTVYEKLMKLGADLLVKTLNGLAAGNIEAQVQDTQQNLKPAPKINKETGKINWQQSTDQVFNLIRGLSPVPGAYTEIDGKMLKIFKAEKDYSSSQGHAGEWQSDHKTFLKFACSDGWIHCLEVQLAGKKRMSIDDFLRGVKLQDHQ